MGETGGPHVIDADALQGLRSSSLKETFVSSPQLLSANLYVFVSFSEVLPLSFGFSGSPCIIVWKAFPPVEVFFLGGEERKTVKAAAFY